LGRYSRTTGAKFELDAAPNRSLLSTLKYGENRVDFQFSGFIFKNLESYASAD